MADETNIDNIEGDLIGGNQTIQGDKVGGDKIEVGDIVGSTNVVIGKNNQQTVNNTAITNIFNQARQALAQSTEVSASDKEDAGQALDALEKLTAEGQTDPKKFNRWLIMLEDTAPAITEMLVNALLGNPGAVAGSAVRNFLKEWQLRRS